MTITSSGAICDVCGKYILPLDPRSRRKGKFIFN